MSADEVISRVRAELEGMSGPARAERLLWLSQAMLDRYWRTGPGAAAGLGDLNDGIAAAQEAHGHLTAGDVLRARAAAMWGMLLAIRHSLHGGSIDDRDTAVQTIEEALESAGMAPMQATMLRFQLGQLYYLRAFGGTNQQALMASMMGGSETPWAGDIDRANECFRHVLSSGPANRDMAEAAQAMLDVGEILRDLLDVRSGGAAGGVSQMMAGMARMQGAMTKLQNLVEQGAGRGPLPGVNFFDAGDMLAGLDPLDRPVAVMHADEPETPAEPSAGPPVQRPEPVPVDPAAVREALHAKLLALAGEGGGEVWAVAAALLHPDAGTPGSDAVDELVALSSLVAEAEGDGVDWFIHAVALGLRDRLEGTADGAESLLRAVQAIPDHHPAAIAVFGALGAFLDARHPAGGLDEAVAREYADRIDAIMVSGAVTSGADLATLHALRCLCRASAGERAELQRAVGTVPLEYPWLATLKAITATVGIDIQGDTR